MKGLFFVGKVFGKEGYSSRKMERMEAQDG